MESTKNKSQKKIVRETIDRGYRVSKYVFYKETLIDYKEHFWSFLGAFVGISLIGFFQSHVLTKIENVFLIGSFGASCVLVYGAIQSPLAQPRNLIGGHVISAIIGVTVFKIVPDIVWINGPLAVALSIVAMQITKTLHPPGGATALIAVIGSEKIKALGYVYVLSPVFTGTLILLIVALVFNNVTQHRKYPMDSKTRTVLKRMFVKKRLLKDEEENA
ncbi:HPP family protein [Wenyingzhuangia sp. 2_MG-2023]|uniref:HPP family protein n=1 Tax=Wenyingzhuangia sp. 2_MG-2023 TaxID=3062639 RepID=UPI0026E27F1A|nr:HPP family protein [Wenyingzhuangia sp. 2_MG-2023]MDO6738536.1 HPP family protein [Wenyingzhuangia sp. 2_MG-2023]